MDNQKAETENNLPDEGHLCVWHIKKQNIFTLGYRVGKEIKVYGKRVTKIPLAFAESFQYVTDGEGNFVKIETKKGAVQQPNGKRTN